MTSSGTEHPVTDRMPLVILDRDGVINLDSPDYIKSPSEWHLIPSSLKAIAALNRIGVQVAIATNQSGIGRGLFDTTALTHIHEKMHTELAKAGGHIDAIFFCPHTPQDQCECRKPKPALLIQALDYFKIDVRQTRVPVIGDSLRDLMAAKSAGGDPILVLTGNGQKTLLNLPADLKNVKVYPDLFCAVQDIWNMPDKADMT